MEALVREEFIVQVLFAAFTFLIDRDKWYSLAEKIKTQSFLFLLL